MEAAVVWSSKGRALLALAIPLFVWLAWYSFTTTNQPSPAAGCAAIVAAVLAVVFQLHAAIYRVEAQPRGISERRLWGTRFVPWEDVLKVEAIAQRSEGGKVVRWASAPEDAFHVVVHARGGRVSVHRWMSGVDAFVDALRVAREGSAYRGSRQAAPLDRDDASVKPLLRRSPVADTAGRVLDRVTLVMIVLLVVPLSWTGGVMITLSARVVLSGNPFVDGTLLTCVPWALGALAYHVVANARRRRFGPEHARLPLTAKDVVLTMAAAMGGPALLYGFVPRALAMRDGVDFALAAAGAFLCWIPVAEVRKALRYA